MSYKKLLFSKIKIVDSLIFSLFFSILLVYAPFLGNRLIRMAGDEKVYVSQAIEMARNGNWFLQSLMDSPNYYKGPIHYILIRIGMIIFGESPWAALYMNLLFVLGGAWALGDLVKRRLPEWQGGVIWVSLFFILNAGTYTYTFTSQMEMGLAGLFAVALNLLDRLKKNEAGFAFWSVVGVLGLFKSPLHSVFAGVSALLFWTLQKELWDRLKNLKAWLALCFGIFICVLGYTPAILEDWQNFYTYYIERETLFKSSGSGQHWSVCIFSTFGFYLFPWVLFALVAYFQSFFQIKKILKNKKVTRLLSLCLIWMIPSVAFFIYHPYRFESYNVPIMSGVILFVSIMWSQSTGVWNTLYRSSFILTGIILLVFPLSISTLVHSFHPSSEWWSNIIEPMAWIGTVCSVIGIFIYGGMNKNFKPQYIALSSIGFFVGLGPFLSAVGEREMIDLRKYIQIYEQRGYTPRMVYYNLHQNIWSEWGFLNFWLKHPVHSVHTPALLRSAVRRGDLILMQADEVLYKKFIEIANQDFPEFDFKKIPWTRWRTRGKSPTGDSLWIQAWKEKDLSILETNYLILKPHPKPDLYRYAKKI